MAILTIMFFLDYMSLYSLKQIPNFVTFAAENGSLMYFVDRLLVFQFTNLVLHFARKIVNSFSSL